jgi:hypothetical protein
MERRVLAGDLVDPGPDSAPDDWPNDADLGDPAPPDAPRDEHPPPRQDTGSDDWWQVADRAVDDAGHALRRVEESLAHARRLVNEACAADADDEDAWQAGPGGRVTRAEEALTALCAATAEQRAGLADLLSRTAGGGLAERPRLALTDAVSGALLALSDLPGLRRAGRCARPACRRKPDQCDHDLRDRPGLGPPGPTDGYRADAELDRYLRARDRRCRFPGCRRRVPHGGELDHDRPYPLGSTSAENLVGYCTTDHRGKHQAPGWRHELAADGTLTVTTPTGLVAVTTPAPY